jgi:glycosyltransferase involved in cell wall biosynthesis
LPLVSIIIPTFNRADLLPQAVDSALSAAEDVEVIVVDDGSEDDTPRVCADLPGIRYLRLNRNLGTPSARNFGVIESRGEFVTALGDDDLRLPGSLEAQVRRLDESPQAAFCYGQVLLADQRRNSLTGEAVPLHTPEGDIFWELLEHNFVPDLSVVARKVRLIEAGLFNPELIGVEDWDMWLRLAERWQVVAVAEPVAVYRKANAASGQVCSDSIEIYRRMRRLQEDVLTRQRARESAPAKRRRARSSLLDNAYKAMIYEADQALTEGDPKLARAKFGEALRLRPLRAATGGSRLLLRRLSAEVFSSMVAP